MLKCLWPNMNQPTIQLSTCFKKLLKLRGVGSNGTPLNFGKGQLSVFQQVPCSSGWWFQPIWKILHSQKWESSPGRGENKKLFENQHLIIHFHGNLKVPPKQPALWRAVSVGPPWPPKHGESEIQRSTPWRHPWPDDHMVLWHGSALHPYLMLPSLDTQKIDGL